MSKFHSAIWLLDKVNVSQDYQWEGKMVNFFDDGDIAFRRGRKKPMPKSLKEALDEYGNNWAAYELLRMYSRFFDNAPFEGIITLQGTADHLCGYVGLGIKDAEIEVTTDWENFEENWKKLAAMCQSLSEKKQQEKVESELRVQQLKDAEASTQGLLRAALVGATVASFDEGVMKLIGIDGKEYAVSIELIGDGWEIEDAEFNVSIAE